MHFWSEEEKEFLRQHYPNHSQKELLELFNEHFSVAISLGQLRAALKRYGIRSGRTGRFEKGQTAWNKNMKGLYLGGENGKKTQFKKGHKPHNYKPIGYERVDRDGYILIKVSDDGPWHKRWKHKHKVIWEKEHGPIPKGHCLIFLDGNKKNVSLNNLQLVTRNQLARMNQLDLIKKQAELTKIGALIAEIHCKIGERKRGGK